MKREKLSSLTSEHGPSKKLMALLATGSLALAGIAGCSTNEANAGTPTESEPAATAEATPTNAEFDPEDNTPYMYYSAEGGGIDGIPEKYQYSSLEEFLEPALNLQPIPTGLSDQEYLEAWVERTNTLLMLGHPDDYKAQPISAVVDGENLGGWEELGDYVRPKLTEAYQSALFADTEVLDAGAYNTSVNVSKIATGNLANAAITDPKYEYTMSGKAMYQFSYALDEGYPIISEPAEGGGRTITFVFNESDNQNENRIRMESHDGEVKGKGNRVFDPHEDEANVQGTGGSFFSHIVTLTTTIDASGNEVIKYWDDEEYTPADL
ncbi:hypothetical protein [Actinomyces qiguomingii]|uniref:hypothetical protein n=1 Tax=Actinomyces qiguomingii TaxID=2057800 RepID=UPI000CA07E13|nr:hypothetical protein [Actinomyces qiguomingii]